MNSLFKKKNNRFLIVFFALFSCILMSVAFIHQPVLTGDGREYLGMTISIKNHLSPELRSTDMVERDALEQKNNITFPLEKNYFGYFQSLKGEYYSYHFWFYSLINSFTYFVLDFFNINALKSFQITNCILFLLLLLKILKSPVINNKSKLMLCLITICSPVVFYLDWSHPEVFSYVLMSLGFLYLNEKKINFTMLFFSLAALQNPAISVLSLYLLISEFFKHRSQLMKDTKTRIDFIFLSLISTINIIPYIFYYLNFREFSLITKAGFSSLKFITFPKIWSLFFDLNFGIIVYTPVLLLFFIYLCFKGHKNVLILSVLLLFISIVNATQWNWNSGMMYINRYSLWYIPVLIFGCFRFIDKFDTKKTVLFSILYICTTGVVTAYCIKEHDFGNYLKLGPLAKMAVVGFPSMYNPEPEIILERIQGTEFLENTVFPMNIFGFDGELRKSIVRDQSSNYIGYINGRSKAALDRRILVSRVYLGNEDIFVNNIEAGFGEGWYSVEGDITAKWRWVASNSYLLVIGDNATHNISFDIKSFYKLRNASIYFNDEIIYQGQIPVDSAIKINHTVSTGQHSIIKIVSNDGSDKPSDLGYGLDKRDLSFSISSFKIE
ncbi:hypothetical protein WMW72_24490 [Paenibacillus filicis]|uniref:Glycosyltransferase RgtA/B/C/D-like domain-containing protein n=1 Tax=Paenibacillus filicis TaxID=669464 RepID=A0ABU9DQC7_9BACL